MKNLHPYHEACDSMTKILLDNKGMHCYFRVVSEAYIKGFTYPELVRDNHGHKLIPGDEYVVVVCRNGYQYHINVTGDSVVTMCAETFNFIQCK